MTSNKTLLVMPNRNAVIHLLIHFLQITQSFMNNSPHIPSVNFMISMASRDRFTGFASAVFSVKKYSSSYNYFNQPIFNRLFKFFFNQNYVFHHHIVQSEAYYVVLVALQALVHLLLFPILRFEKISCYMQRVHKHLWLVQLLH